MAKIDEHLSQMMKLTNSTATEPGAVIFEIIGDARVKVTLCAGNQTLSSGFTRENFESLIQKFKELKK